jgi:protein SCO1/2/putative membrane protein
MIRHFLAILIAILITVIGLGTVECSAVLPDYGAVGPFSLTRESGKSFTEKDLEGKLWVMDFIFTRCSGPCPLLSRQMAKIQEKLPEGAGLLSITVDPEYDSPEILSEYAQRFNADPSRWLFLTGKREDVYRVIQNQFLNAVESNPDAVSVGEAFIHSQRFVLLDESGHIRGFYDGEDAATPRKILRDLKFMNASHQVPRVNALLNMMSAFFLLSGYFFIRRKRIGAHRVSMGLAFLSSTVFLVSYIIYHLKTGSMPFTGEGWIRTFYFTLLISHSILAVMIVPMILVTLYRALKRNFAAHKSIARWTFPLWLYVSVTGVVVYWMLYKI